MEKLSNKEIRKAIESLKSNGVKDDYAFIMHPLTAHRLEFQFAFPELVTRAWEINGHLGIDDEKPIKSIYDRRTRGWKIIKEEYEKFPFMNIKIDEINSRAVRY